MFKHRFYYVTGSKGGVGKSLVANALAFNLIEQGKIVRIIETDDTNPDVGRVYKKSVPVVELPLSDDSKSWGAFLNTLDSLASEEDNQIHVVVNGAARDNKTIENNGDLLNGVFEEGLNYEFTTLWVMNDSTDSVDLLRSYLKVVHVGTLFALRNLHFGRKEDFATFNEAYPGFKKRLNAVYDFPDMESNIASQIHRDRILLSDVEKTLEIGSRMLFKRWLNGTRKIFSDMNDILTQLENVNMLNENEQ